MSHYGQSDKIGELMAALAAAQAEIENVTKEGKAKITTAKGNYSFSYPRLEDALREIRPILAKHGVVLTQRPYYDSDLQMMMLNTRLFKGEQWIDSNYPVVRMDAGVDAKQVGGAVTYARRYSLFPLLGVAGEDDDHDGDAVRAQIGARPPARPIPTMPPQIRAPHTQTAVPPVPPVNDPYAIHVATVGSPEERMKAWSARFLELLPTAAARGEVLSVIARYKVHLERMASLNPAIYAKVSKVITQYAGVDPFAVAPEKGNGSPDPAPAFSGNPEPVRKWVDQLLSKIPDGSGQLPELESLYNDHVAPRIGDMFPHDQSDILKLYEQHEARVAGEAP